MAAHSPMSGVSVETLALSLDERPFFSSSTSPGLTLDMVSSSESRTDSSLVATVSMFCRAIDGRGVHRQHNEHSTSESSKPPANSRRRRFLPLRHPAPRKDTRSPSFTNPQQCTHSHTRPHAHIHTSRHWRPDTTIVIMDQEWVLDSLIGFLKGPLWSEPVFAFLDERSVVFDAEDLADNQGEYKKVYADYKKLVDSLLDSHMNELQITPQQFEQAVQEAQEFLSERLQQTLFEQIWAADHFDSFKRMMIQVNIDLQLWALEILAAKYGIIPQLFLPEGCTMEDFIPSDKSDDFFVVQAKLRSLVNQTAQENSKQVQVNKGEAITSPYEQPAQISTSTGEESTEKEPQVEQYNSQPVEEREEKELKLDLKEDTSAPIEYSPSDDSRVQEALNSLLDVQIKRPKTAGVRESGIRTVRSKLQEDKEEMDAEEIRKRQAYLRSQRDRLLKLKKEEREQQVKRMQELQQSGQRPPTAKFIQMEKERQEQSNQGRPDRALAYMRSLAARIKSEVSGPG